MAYPLLENALGKIYFYDGAFISANSSVAISLLNPFEESTYYETIRFKSGVLLFLEDHLDRLVRSVSSTEDFAFDVFKVRELLCDFVVKAYDSSLPTDCNVRVVITRVHTLFYFCEANIPDKFSFINGVCTRTLNWERVSPNVKVFRGEYKEAVARAFSMQTKFGKPYEIILSDNKGKLYEGSKSNFFAIIGNEVYSAPDSKILIGITRQRVLSSLEKVGCKLVTDMFTLAELSNMREEVALFISSTPFDILPIASVDDIEFCSTSNLKLQQIMRIYSDITNNYINDHRR